MRRPVTAGRHGPLAPVRGLTAVLLATLTLVLAGAPAAAHTKLSSSDPADGATHDGALAAITLTYTLPVTPLGDTVVVTGPDGSVPVEVTQEQEGTVVVATPPRDLTDGDYTVEWNVAAQDGHPLQGTVRFTVTGAPPSGQAEAPRDPEEEPTAGAGAGGNAAGDPDEPEAAHDGTSKDDTNAGSSTASTVAAVVARIGNAAALWGLLVAAGGLLFAGRVLRGSDRVDRPTVLAAVRWTGAIIAAGLAIRVVARTVIVAQGDTAAAVTPGAYADALAGPTRWVFLLQVAGAAALLVGTRRSLRGSWLALGGTALVGAGQVLDGHSATGGVPWLVALTDVAHLAAASAWVGGLVVMVLVLRRRRREGRMLDAGLLGARFSVVAGLSVVVLGFAGVLLAVDILERPAQLWQTSWGMLLLAKVALVTVVGLVGAYNHFRLVPRLERPGRNARAAHLAVNRLEHTARWESGLLTVVVVLTAWLVTASVHA